MSSFVVVFFFCRRVNDDDMVIDVFDGFFLHLSVLERTRSNLVLRSV